ncbi:hypothetical protein DFQ26_008951 [Actinomortierella ambigua]|nr:hypothetical protein DFQ26_008951 [Actinomortierella ambigua]
MAPERVALPKTVKPVHYKVELSPDLEKFTFRGYVAIDIHVNEPTSTIQLNTKELTLDNTWVEIAANDGRLEPESTGYDEAHEITTLKFASEVPKGDAKLHMTFDGTLNDKMKGFYRSKYKDAEGKEKYLGTTQFEATDARMAFPCWDEPALKATFAISLDIPSELTALSNMPVKELTAVEPERITYHFETTPVMSTYLVAFAVGEFEYVEATTTELEKPVVCRVYTTPGQKEQGRFALEITPKILEYFTKIFGTEYPLPKLDQIAIPDFDAGAMENWGLITYRTVALLFDEKTSDKRFKESVASTVAHEIAHQWFGNLVTMEWWDHLWLNEGFATWVGTLAVDHLFPEWHTWSNFVVDDLQYGLGLDCLRSSHPIEVPVADPHEIPQIFDSISYSKGGSVIRMLSNWLTLDVFLAGIRRYLKKHAYKNASTDDLWDALSEESGIDVREFMNTWTRVIGFPIMDVQEENGVITVEQHRFLSTNDVKPEEDETIWWVPLGAYPKPASIQDSNQTLKTRKISFEIPEAKENSFYMLNKDYTGVFRTKYSPENLRRLGEAIASGHPAFGLNERAGLLADQAALAVSGHGSVKDFLDLVQYYKNERSYIVWKLLLSKIDTIVNMFSANEATHQGLLEFQRKLVGPLADELGWEFPEGEDYLVSRLRASIVGAAGRAGYENTVKEAKRRFKLFMEAIKAGDKDADKHIHPSLRQAAFTVALQQGGRDAFDDVVLYYDKSEKAEQQVVTLQALGAGIVDKEVMKDFYTFLWSDKVRSQDMIYGVLQQGANYYAREMVWEWTKCCWELLVERYKGGMGMLGYFIKAPLRYRSGQKIMEEVEKFFETRDTKDFKRDLDQAKESMAINTAWLERDLAAVEAWLGKN